MDVFKRLKSVFVVNDEEFKKKVGGAEKAEPETKQEAVVDEVKKPEPSNIDIEITTPDKADVKVDSKFVDILLKAIEKNNLEGFDYLEFKQSLQNLKDMNMDEPTKYKSALAMAKTMGATSTSIVSSGNHYLSILQAEDQKFKKALAQQKGRLEQEKSNGLTQLQNEIKQKEEQIKRLQSEIVEAKKTLEQKEKQINTSANKIGHTAATFAKAYELVANQIVDDLKLIQKHTN